VKKDAGAGIARVDVVPDSALDAGLINSVPVEWVRRHSVLPVRLDGRLCMLSGTSDIIDVHEELEMILGQELKLVLSSQATITDAIQRVYVSQDGRAGDFISDLGADDEAEYVDETRGEDLLQDGGGNPVTRLINLILLDALKASASDVHVEPLDDSLRVRFRIDGVLYEQPSPPKKLESELISRLKVMAHMDIAEKRLPQDGTARVRVGDREVDVRVSSIPTREGERMVLRLLDRSDAMLSLDALGMPISVRAGFDSVVEHSNGLVLVTGPTGSGKTTTLYAALGTLNSQRRNIMTIEDPIEYSLPSIAQIQVKPKIGLSFAHGLRHILRQDPDIVLVGETRDKETAEIAVKSSLTGHLVFTTVHTNDAVSAVIRFMDMGIEPYLLAASLRGVLAQRLVRRLCGHCRRADAFGPEDALRWPGGVVPEVGTPVYVAVGCDECLDGYRGRVGVFEFLSISEGLEDLVRTCDGSLQALRDAASRQGMRSLMHDAISKLRAGETTVDEVVRTIG